MAAKQPEMNADGSARNEDSPEQHTYKVKNLATGEVHTERAGSEAQAVLMAKEHFGPQYAYEVQGGGGSSKKRTASKSRKKHSGRSKPRASSKAGSKKRPVTNPSAKPEVKPRAGFHPKPSNTTPPQSAVKNATSTTDPATGSEVK